MKWSAHNAKKQAQRRKHMRILQARLSRLRQQSPSCPSSVSIVNVSLIRETIRIALANTK